MQQFYSYPGQPDRVEVVRLTAAGRGQRDVCGHGAAVTKWKNPKRSILAESENYDEQGWD